MTVTTLIFPLAKSAKTIGKSGLAFRCCTSLRKSGKQLEEKTANYENMFFDCKTFNKSVIDTIYKAAADKKGIDITAYVEANFWTDKNGNERQNLVFNITEASVHEKANKVENIPF